MDNGDPTSFEPFQAAGRKAYNGLALVIVRTRAGESGRLVVEALSEGLRPARIMLSSAP